MRCRKKTALLMGKWALQTHVTISNSIVIVRIWTIKGYDNKLEKNRRNINYDSGRKNKTVEK